MVMIQNTELRDRVVRCLAEIDSVRVRCQKDVDNAKQFGAQKFAKGMLPVMDVMVRW